MRLIFYNVLDKENINKIPEKFKKEISNLKNRYKLFKLFNETIKKYCEIYNIKFINLEKNFFQKKKSL